MTIVIVRPVIPRNKIKAFGQFVWNRIYKRRNIFVVVINSGINDSNAHRFNLSLLYIVVVEILVKEMVVSPPSVESKESVYGISYPACRFAKTSRNTSRLILSPLIFI